LVPCLRRVEAEAIPSLYIIMLDMVESHAIDNAVKSQGFTLPCECCGSNASKSSVTTTFSKMRKLFRLRLAQPEGSVPEGSFEALSNRHHCALCLSPPLAKGGHQEVVRPYTIPRRTYREVFHQLLAFYEALSPPPWTPTPVVPTAFQEVARALPMAELPEEQAVLFSQLVETSALDAEALPEAESVMLHRQAHHLVLAKAIAAKAHCGFMRAEEDAVRAKEEAVRAKAVLSQARARMGLTQMYARDYERAVVHGKAEPSFLEMKGLSMQGGAADGGAPAQGAQGGAADGGAPAQGAQGGATDGGAQ
jgi:hypothetical protein